MQVTDLENRIKELNDAISEHVKQHNALITNREAEVSASMAQYNKLLGELSATAKIHADMLNESN